MKTSEGKVFEDAINTFGTTPQILMAMEEMGELIQALSKNFRGKNNRDNIAEEIADVGIMLDQLKIVFSVEFEEEKWREIKIERLKERIMNHNVED